MRKIFRKEYLVMIKYILLLFTLCTTISCVTNNFSSYQPVDNLSKTKDYYEIQEPDGRVNYIKVGLNTIYNIQNDYFIYIVFKSKVKSVTNIQSTTFGKIDKSKSEKVYLKKINKMKMDTIYVSLSNKVFTFYYKENLK
ncbi:hypothetical protein DBR39_08860 [Chryseobacterium sp. KBW03]|nr:hypothetical protein DBR39_08860 [Chryseobacterium sp. KBW03]